MAAVSDSTSRRFLRLSALLPATVLAGAATGCTSGDQPEPAAPVTPIAAGAPAAPPLVITATARATLTPMPAVDITIRWNGLDPQGQAAARDFAAAVLACDRINITPDFSDWVRPSGQKVVEMYIDKYMGYKLTKSPASVYTVLERLSDLDANLAINAESRRSMPCRVAMESHPIFARSPWREFAAGTRYAVPQPTVDEHFDWYPRLGPWIDAAASGRITVAEALAGIGSGLTGAATN